jgi:hypothetical protein
MTLRRRGIESAQTGLGHPTNQLQNSTDAPIGRSNPRRHAEQAEAVVALRRDNDEFVIML